MSGCVPHASALWMHSTKGMRSHTQLKHTSCHVVLTFLARPNRGDPGAVHVTGGVHRACEATVAGGRADIATGLAVTGGCKTAAVAWGRRQGAGAHGCSCITGNVWAVHKQR